MQIHLQPGCVSGVGSLPFTDVPRAIRFVARHCPELPFWPQLPKRHRDEGVIAQGLGPLVGQLEPAADPYCRRLRPGTSDDFFAALDEEEAGLLPATAAGFFAFEAALRDGEFPDAAAVKAQSEGPVTLAHCLFADGRPVVCRPDWVDRIAAYLARQAVWQIQRLQQFGKPVVFVLDEPAISLALEETAWTNAAILVAAINRVLLAVRQAGAVAGLHCCAPLPLSILQALDLDLISFDAHLPMDWRNWPNLTHSILARGGYVAFGLVPTDSGKQADTSALFAQWLRLAAVAGDVMEIANRTIVTATCGLGLGTSAHAAVVFDRCRQVGERIRDLFERNDTLPR